MFNFLKKFDPIVHLFFLFAIVTLFSLVLAMREKIDELNLALLRKESAPPQVVEEGAMAGEKLDRVMEEDIKRIVSDIVSTISATPQTVVKKETAVLDGKTSYIPLGSSATTTSTDWVDVEDAKVWIDLETDYGKNAKVSWEVSLKVAHANGQAFARLYDDTNKITVLGSEVYTVNNSDFKQVSSGNLNLWAGRNLYKVQIKSLNSFQVTYSGGRIKISY